MPTQGGEVNRRAYLRECLTPTKRMISGWVESSTASNCGRPVHAKVDVERRDLDAFVRTILGVLCRLHQRDNRPWILRAELQDFVEELVHVRRRETGPRDHLVSELPGHRVLKVSDFVLLGTVRVKGLKKPGVFHVTRSGNCTYRRRAPPHHFADSCRKGV